MSNFSNIHHQIDGPEPSPLFEYAYQCAGEHLQKQFDRLRHKDFTSSYDGFKWIKAKYTYPAFDHFTFAYKNALFCVIIEFINEEGQSSFDKQQKDRLVKAANDFKLIPCLFKIHTKQRDNGEIQLAMANNKWNLYDVDNGDELNPELIAGDEQIPMSEWELQNFAIQVIRDDLERNGNRVVTYCDLVGVYPQIWFDDEKGNRCWVLVKQSTSKETIDYLEYTGLENSNPQLQSYDGFFANVEFYVEDQLNLNRGNHCHVKFEGLKRIYVC